MPNWEDATQRPLSVDRGGQGELWTIHVLDDVSDVHFKCTSMLSQHPPAIVLSGHSFEPTPPLVTEYALQFASQVGLSEAQNCKFDALPIQSVHPLNTKRCEDASKLSCFHFQFLCDW